MEKRLKFKVKINKKIIESHQIFLFDMCWTFLVSIYDQSYCQYIYRVLVERQAPCYEY